MRLRNQVLFVACLCLMISARAAHAQWSPGGTLVCGAPYTGQSPRVVSDDAGGCFVAWDDQTGRASDDPRVFLRHFDALGRPLAGWPARGLRCCTFDSPQGVRRLEPDGSGGVFVFWTDQRDPDTVGVYVTRVAASGQIEQGWPPEGVRLMAHFQDYAPTVFRDGSGGVFVTVVDERNIPTSTGLDLFIQHLTGTGSRAPGWPADGRPVALAQADQEAHGYGACSDGRGGFYFSWANSSTGVLAGYAQHLSAEGVPSPGWPIEGKTVLTNFGIGQVFPRPDGGFIAIAGTPGAAYFLDSDLYSVAFDSTGALVPAFSSGPKPLAIAPDVQWQVLAAADASDGLYVVWVDYRDYFTKGVALYMQHLDSNGDPRPGWIQNGVPAILGCGGIDSGLLVTDAQGGVFATAHGQLAADVIWAAHRLPAGAVAPSWAPLGEPVTTAPDAQKYPSLAADDRGGAFIAYQSPTYGHAGPEIFVQHLSADAPVAVDVALVSSAVSAGGIELDWFAPGSSPGAVFALERATGAAGAWGAIANVQTDGTGHVRFDDQAVAPGTRYGYRLGRASNTGIAYTSETWLSTPSASRFALTGATPNPAPRGNLHIAFALPTAEPATLELYDLSGRRIAAESVGMLGPGEHALQLHPAGALDAGIYWLRLSQGTQRATTRVVIAG